MLHPTLGLAVALGLAIFFFRAAEFEQLRFPIIWGAGSFLLSIAVLNGLGWGILGVLGVQFVLFVILGLVRYVEQQRRGP